jgi:SAM-dependent methyltransferase
MAIAARLIGNQTMTNAFAPLAQAELSRLDALLVAREGPWWDAFYQDRAKPCPFFVPFPDESLAHWLDGRLIQPGRALDLGCGHGRNAIFLARRGFSVEGVDYSREALDWAAARVAEAGVAVTLTNRSVFEWEPEPASYDLVYDSGCFHHIPPHRRLGYVELVVRALKPGGWFGLTCFRPEGGSGYSDDEVYEHRSMAGGLGFTEERLREIWSQGLQVRRVRQMNKPSADSGLFGEDFLWVLLAQKVAA